MTPVADDVELVQAALGGRAGARRSLAERLLDSIQREVAIALQRSAIARGRDPRQEVQDLVQDVVVMLFEHDARELRRWDPARGRSLDSFVRLLARRRVARVLSQRRGNPWADGEAEYHEAADEAALADRLEGRAQLGQVLQRLYAEMSPRDMELFELLFVQGLEPPDVALALSMSRGAVNAWAYRTRRTARAIAERIAKAPSSASGSDTTGSMTDV
ncbi:MAG: sigma-70 region 4 domain-containing protein [Deltaproteobacteria bacterium]|nr:sigma-70 region 4 domain-containing protein [Deltaproteobacteria bacterium]